MSDPTVRLRHLAEAVYGLSGNPAASRITDALFKAPVRADIDPSIAEGLEGAVETDTLADVDQWQFLRDIVPALKGKRLLDYGCGRKADHRQTIESFGYEWWGLEVADTRDPGTRTALADLAANPRVMLYDGGGIPRPAGTFDVVFSNQSLEHVHNCDAALGEIARVLAPGGYLVGSVSHLEPYHGFSTFNYTPYGFALVAKRHGLQMRPITPGLDAFALITRVLLCKLGQDAAVDQMFDLFYRKPPLNGLIDEIGSRLGLPIRATNLLKLNMCAQFRFALERSEEPAGADR